MKLSIAILATTACARMKETEVQDAYFAGEEIVLTNPAARSTKQWHDCGEAPPLPANARAVECSGDKCAAVCPIGWRSQARWTIKCKADNTWAHSKFSPCITCPSMRDELDKVVEAESGVAYQEIIHKKQNLPWTQFFCGTADAKSLLIKNRLFKKGKNKRSVKCICKNGRNGDPAWKKSCDWEFQGKPWSPSDVNDVQCKTRTNDKKKCPDRKRRSPVGDDGWSGGYEVPAPEYLSVPALMKCTGEKEMDGWLAFCKPTEKSADCPKDSWDQLYGECGVADFLPICDQKKKKCPEQVKPTSPPGCNPLFTHCKPTPPHELVPHWKKCVQFFRAFGNFQVGCEPAEIPEDCPVDSWLQLFGECGVSKLDLCSDLE